MQKVAVSVVLCLLWLAGEGIGQHLDHLPQLPQQHRPQQQLPHQVHNRPLPHNQDDYEIPEQFEHKQPGFDLLDEADKPKNHKNQPQLPNHQRWPHDWFDKFPFLPRFDPNDYIPELPDLPDWLRPPKKAPSGKNANNDDNENESEIIEIPDKEGSGDDDDDDDDSWIDDLLKEKKFVATHARISDGQEVKIRDYPSLAMILILDTNKRSRACTASILSNQYLLTAASCMVQPKSLISQMHVILGADNLGNDNRIVRPAYRLIVHPKYGGDNSAFSGRNYDAAIVEMDFVSYSPTIRPATLADAQNFNHWTQLGPDHYVVGYGQEHNYDTKFGQLRRGNVITEECRNNDPVNGTFYCLQPNPGNPCGHDIGAPVMAGSIDEGQVTVGIVSNYNGMQCEDFLNRNEYTDISKLYDWIYEAIAILVCSQ